MCFWTNTWAKANMDKFARLDWQQNLKIKMRKFMRARSWRSLILRSLKSTPFKRKSRSKTQLTLNTA